MLILSCVLFGGKWDAPAVAVYIDINPGVMMEVNSMGNVIGTASTNMDGAMMLEDAKPRGRIDKALDTYFKAVQNAGFDIKQGGNNKVLLTIISDDDALTGKFSDILNQVLDKVNVDIVIASKQDEARAFEMGVTPGRLLKAEEVSGYNPQVPIINIARADINQITAPPDAVPDDTSEGITGETTAPETIVPNGETGILESEGNSESEIPVTADAVPGSDTDTLP
jgi:hypothetical protein